MQNEYSGVIQDCFKQLNDCLAHKLCQHYEANLEHQKPHFWSISNKILLNSIKGTK